MGSEMCIRDRHRAVVADQTLDHLRGDHSAAVPGDDLGIAVLPVQRTQQPLSLIHI